MLPSSRLFVSSRSDKLASVPMELGIDPVRKLSVKIKAYSCVRLLIELGMLPCNTKSLSLN